MRKTSSDIGANNAQPDHTAHLKTAYRRSGLALLGITFDHAMQATAIRIALECAVKASNKGKPAPVQPALI